MNIKDFIKAITIDFIIKLIIFVFIVILLVIAGMLLEKEKAFRQSQNYAIEFIENNCEWKIFQNIQKEDQTTPDWILSHYNLTNKTIGDEIR